MAGGGEPLGLAPGQEQRAGDRTTPVAHRRYLGETRPASQHLAGTAFASELDAGFVDEAEPVQTPSGQLAARRVEGQ